MSRPNDEYARQFQARLAQLGEPVLREVLDPLVVDAKDYAVRHPEGGATIVGASESALLRAAPNRKYPLYLFVDALCRSRSEFPFRTHFSRNLEHIFPHVVTEADEPGRIKLLRLLNIWRDKESFDLALLERIRARCDPSYRGPPLDALPKPAAAAAEPSVYVSRPAPPPLLAAPVQAPPPVQPQQVVDQAALFQRAAEVLSRMYDQMRTPHTHRFSLDAIFRTNSALYNQIMGTAHSELLYGAPPTPPVPLLAAPPQQPQHPMSHHLLHAPPPQQPAHVLPHQQQTVPLQPPAPTTMVIPKLSAQTLLDRAPVPLFVARLVEEGLPVKRKDGNLPEADNSTIFVRTWTVSDAEWLQKVPRPPVQAVKLFANTTGTRSTPNTPDPTLAIIDESGSSVPKDDSQTECALSGEAFETFWSEDDQAWMYKGAIRPDPNGPIYKVHAWLAHQRSHHQKIGADLALPELDANHPAKRIRVTSSV